MNLRLRCLLIGFLVFSLCHILSASTQVDSLPPVFMIGDFEKKYEKLVESCSDPLYKVCDNSMDKSYEAWISVLKDLEVFAKKEEFDILGVKLFLNIYWNGEGQIKHMVYSPKPNSKNIDFFAMSKMFERFIENYKMPYEHSNCFNHNGSASFPTHSDYYLSK